jgi:hypothetical protein
VEKNGEEENGEEALAVEENREERRPLQALQWRRMERRGGPCSGGEWRGRMKKIWPGPCSGEEANQYHLV